MPTTLTLQPTGQVLTVPTRWADVSLAMFVERYAGPSERSPAEIFCNLPAGAFNELAVEDVHYIANLLTFTLDTSDVTNLPPTPGLPDVGGLPWGCLVLVQQRFEANAELPDLASLPYVLAVYRSQLTWGNTGKAGQILQQLLAAPVTEVYADGSFFLQACRTCRPGTPRTKPTTVSPKKKKRKPVSKSLANASGRFSAWIRRLAGPS
jgi:hypothetical protein